MARPTRGGDNPATPAPPSPEELANLLGRASRGDEQAWRELINLYSRRIFALARSRLRDPDLAEEVAQSVFVTVANKLRDEKTGGSYSEQGKFEPWLFRVAVNRIRDEVRRMQRQAVTVDDSHLDRATAAPTSNGAADPAPLNALRTALTHLSGADRQIIELRHHAGLSFASIAELLDEPLGTLLARHHRALKKLKDLLTTAPTAPAEEELA